MIRFKLDRIFPSGRDWIRGLACQLMIVVKTRGEIADATMQKRSICTFFKEFHDKYPDLDINKFRRPKRNNGVCSRLRGVGFWSPISAANIIDAG